MPTRKILTILGTRPEAIKLAPVIHALRRSPELFTSVVCATAQHRQLLEHALVPLRIKPDIDLDIMRPGQSLAALTSRATTELDEVIARERPDVVLVQGDTTTAFCGALAAFYHNVTIGHVEAGLRTWNKYSPFPEEANRCFISQIADLHFAPTDSARRALVTSGINEQKIFVTGNTVIDALYLVRDDVLAGQPPAALHSLVQAARNRDVVLITGHRRESFGGPFKEMCGAIREAADRAEKALFIYPVHLNPNVREPVSRILANHPRIHLIDPLPYDAFIWLMARATLILTDSGGVQEEAPALGKPVLVMREITERTEAVEQGSAILVGVRQEGIAATLLMLLASPERRAQMVPAASPYGDGRAAERIVEVLGRL